MAKIGVEQAFQIIIKIYNYAFTNVHLKNCDDHLNVFGDQYSDFDILAREFFSNNNT